MHASEIVKFSVGTSVLIDQRLFMSKCKNSGNRAIAFECQSDLERFTKTIDHVSKPTAGLWRDTMPSARKQLQTVELFKDRFGASHLLRQPFPFGAFDFSLRGILMEIAEEGFYGRLEVQCVKAIRHDGAKKCLDTVGRTKRTYLNVSLLLFLALLRQSSQQDRNTCWSIN